MKIDEQPPLESVSLTDVVVGYRPDSTAPFDTWTVGTLLAPAFADATAKVAAHNGAANPHPGKFAADDLSGAGAQAALGGSPADAGALPALSGLSLARVWVERPFDLLPDRFVSRDERFAAKLAGNTNVLLLNGGATLTTAGVSIGATQGTALCIKDTFVSPCITIQGWFAAPPATGANRYIGVGLGNRASGNPLDKTSFVFYNHVAGNIGIDTRSGGVTVSGATISFTASAAFALSVTFYNNKVCVFADTGNGWRYVGGWADISTPLDLRDPAKLADLCPMVIGQSSDTGWVCNRVRAGYAGHTGIQNQYALKNEDGELIYDARGRYYIQGTAVLPSADMTTVSGWDFSHTAIWAVDSVTLVAEPVAKVFLQRDGANCNDDISGVILYDRIARKWRVCMQNSSQLGVVDAKVYMWETKENLLEGVHVLASSSLLALPATYGAWDLDLFWSPSESMWYAAYAVRSVAISGGFFYPRLAKGPTLSSLSIVGSDTSNVNAEGSRFVKVGGVMYAANVGASGIVFYNLSDFSVARTYTPTNFITATPKPHANILPVRVGGLMRYILDTFDGVLDHGGGTSTYGNRVIYASSYYEGAEFPLSPNLLPPRV